MIPQFREGRLPEGIHEATWADVEARFGTTVRRLRLLALLRVALEHFAEAGCHRVFLAGSFVTAKPNPKDVDVCWDVTDVDPALVHPMFLDPGVGRTVTLAMFGAEFFPAQGIEADSDEPFLDFFQTTRDGEPVGIVVVDLETL